MLDTNFTLNCTIDINVKGKIINILGENIGENYCDLILNQGENSRYSTKKNQFKKKIDKLNFTNIKYYFSVNDTVKKMKTQAIDMEKLFENLISDKDFGSRIYMNS